MFYSPHSLIFTPNCQYDVGYEEKYLFSFSCKRSNFSPCVLSLRYPCEKIELHLYRNSYAGNYIFLDITRLYEWSWLDRRRRLLIRRRARVVRHVSPSGFNASSLTQANARRDIHSFSSLHSFLSSRVEITTCPNCRRKSVRLVKTHAYLNYMYVFLLHTSLLRFTRVTAELYARIKGRRLCKVIAAYNFTIPNNYRSPIVSRLYWSIVVFRDTHWKVDMKKICKIYISFRYKIAA